MSIAPTWLFAAAGVIGFGVLLAAAVAIVWAIASNRRAK